MTQKERLMVSTTREERKHIRQLLKITKHWSIPIVVIEGADFPKQKGTSYHYETRGGTIIYHPSSYSKTGWSNMVYMPSTNRIEVGKDWILKELRKVKTICESCKHD